MKRFIINFFLILSIAGFLSCQSNAAPAYIPDNIMNDKPQIPSNPAIDYVRNLGLAINIGNTLDAIGSNEWHAGETGWGNPHIDKGYIKALKKYGYKTIRLPVTWAEYIGPAPDFIIAEERMSRVEQVVNWILAEDMHVIVNLHHDGGESDKSFIRNFADDPDGVEKQFVAVWKQIAQRFSGVSQEKLIFESMNEVGFDELWDRFSGRGQKQKAFKLLNELNQIFVNTVRATPGNDNRFLLIAGYWTDIGLSVDPLFVMPTDTVAHRLILSVHYYTPSTFCLVEETDNSWGFRSTWGTSMDYEELLSEFAKLRSGFIDKGIPVIMGEYGAVLLVNKDDVSRAKWMAAVTRLCLNYGICPVLWDTGWKTDNDGNDFGGEISRHPPYAMRDSLKAVWAAIKR